jgi:N-acetylglucosamine repressor
MSKVSAKNQIRRNRILRLLLDSGHLSLSEISKRTGISLPMISKLVTEMKTDHLVDTEEGARVERVGRPPIIAHLNGNAGYVVGVDLGRRTTNIVLLNLEQRIILEKHIPSFPLGHDPKIINWITDQINHSIDEAVVQKQKLLGIGLSIPGIVRGREGTSETYLNFGDKSVRQMLAEQFQKPVHIEHDAKAMALGEWWFGAAKNLSNVLVLNIGWGLGLGILIDGKIYYGRDGFAGEFGHIQIIPDGILCRCGKRGCLETVASGMAIGRIAREKISSGAVSKLTEFCEGNIESIDAELVTKAALRGDSFSIEVLEEAGRYLGVGVSHLINIFNPEKIILGGRVSQADHFILDPVRASALKQSYVPLSNGVEFLISRLGGNAGALGVAMLATRDIFEVDHLNPSALV